MQDWQLGCRLIAIAVLGAAPALGASEQFSMVFLGGGSARAGAEQGVREANVQGRFTGQNYALISGDETRQPNPIAVLMAGNAKALRRASRQYPSLPIFNLIEDDDNLRDECIPNLLHVTPSRRMKQDAQAQWRGANGASTARVRAWHHRFKKYAAAQLNGRYQAATQQPMDDSAWAGWAAAKIVSDTLARIKLRDAEQLLAALRTELAFDGQKGIAMSFRDNGQLRQPLLLIEGDRVVGEAPVRGVAGATELDSLGTSSCPK